MKFGHYKGQVVEGELSEVFSAHCQVVVLDNGVECCRPSYFERLVVAVDAEQAIDIYATALFADAASVTDVSTTLTERGVEKRYITHNLDRAPEHVIISADPCRALDLSAEARGE